MTSWKITVLSALCLVGTVACSTDGITGNDDLPPNIANPAMAKTADGAHGAYVTALMLLRDAIGNGDSSYVVQTARLTDESALNPADYSISNGGTILGPGYADLRSLPEGINDRQQGPLYRMLQRVRAQANQARGLLRDYYPAEDNGPLIAHMYAASGYAELMLAEAFCSGVPLSTLDYDGNYTLQAGSATTVILNHAIAQFDSAIALSGDSARILDLARVGKGRALLQLGEITEAAQAVQDVPDAARYEERYRVDAKVCGLLDCTYTPAYSFLNLPKDREGDNGLPFVSEPDARISGLIDANAPYAGRMDIPSNHTIVLSSGIEAQLIRAEAELSAGDSHWLMRLNTLRTTCSTAATCPSPAPAGIGGVAGLPPLDDPGSDTARVTLLFRERAYWLYLTGHRQGDLRRLVRNYRRPTESVYPTGIYSANFLYGADVTFPVPNAERELNPLFHGCINRNA
jgi:hypothetical protein